MLLLFVTRCLKVYKLFRHISLKLLTSVATNIPLALQVLSYFIILLKAWLYPNCSFLTVPFLYWLHIWQQYIIQQNVLKSFTFTLGEHEEKFLIRLLHHVLKPNKSADDAKNYRPISLLCVPLKLLERLLLSRLDPVIDPQLPTEQAGFRQVTLLTDDIDVGFEHNHTVGVALVTLLQPTILFGYVVSI